MIPRAKKRLKVLPTGKPHISYSELSDWSACSFRHKLKYVDKILLDKGSIHTIYGQVIHDALENRVNFYKGIDKELNDPEFYKQKFRDDFTKYLREDIKFEKSKEGREAKTKLILLYKRFVETIANICENVIEWLNREFPEWEPVEAEIQIFEPISDHELEQEFFFKGFIDLVIKTPKYTGRGEKRRKVEGEWVYHIIDWKSTEWGWTRDKKEDKIKQAQLLCYKNYFSRIRSIPLEQITCAWALAKRKPKKGELPFELIEISSTQKRIDEAVFLVRSMIQMLLLELYSRNYKECFYCVYRTTEHCDMTKVQP